MNILKTKNLIYLFVLLFSFSAALSAQPTSPEQLRDELTAAMKSQDKEMISVLFNWEGVDDQMKQYSERNINQMAEYPADKIELHPLPDGFKTEFIRDGIRYTPNVKLVGVLRIVYGEDGPEAITDATIPYGVKDGKYYLPNTVSEKTSYKGPADKTINIGIVGLSDGEPVKFDGECVYRVSGEEKVKAIKGEGNITEAFWGQDVKSCNIKRVSNSGSMKLNIFVDGQNVFSSEMKDTTEITYP